MKLSSPDDDIQGCELSNVAPVSASTPPVVLLTISELRTVASVLPWIVMPTLFPANTEL